MVKETDTVQAFMDPAEKWENGLVQRPLKHTDGGRAGAGLWLGRCRAVTRQV